MSDQNESMRLITLTDPRSPTVGIHRTPILVLEKNRTKNEVSPAASDVAPIINQENSMDYDEEYSKSEESYFTASEPNSFSHCDSMMINDDEQVADESEEAIIKSSEQKASDDIENNENFKQLTDIKKSKALDNLYDVRPSFGISVPNKLLNNVLGTPRVCRLPLDSLDSNVIFPSTPPSRYATDSPQYILRQKQWKRLEHEKLKMGIATDENGLPPFADVTASAPSKLTKMSKFGSGHIQ